MTNYNEIDWYKHQEVLEKYIDKEILGLNTKKGQHGEKIHYIIILSKLAHDITVECSMFEGGLHPDSLDFEYSNWSAKDE